jgi:hypothetical protein
MHYTEINMMDDPVEEEETIIWCVGGCGTDVSYDGVYTPDGEGPYCDDCFGDYSPPEPFENEYGYFDEEGEYVLYDN